MTAARALLVGLVAGGAALLGGCDGLSPVVAKRPDSAVAFPAPDREVAQVVSNQFSNEDARDERGEAKVVMDLADMRPGMTVADIGAGEGYYTVRLAERVGADGRVLAQDISREALDRLGRRVERERLENISITLGGVYGRQSLNGSSDFGLDLRGFGTNSSQNMVIVVDGVRLSENELSNAILSTIPVDSVDRIEITRGGASVLYGDGATGGVINIVTKRGSNEFHAGANIFWTPDSLPAWRSSRAPSPGDTPGYWTGRPSMSR